MTIAQAVSPLFSSLALVLLLFLFFVRRGLKRREGEALGLEPTWLREITESRPLAELEAGRLDPNLSTEARRQHVTEQVEEIVVGRGLSVLGCDGGGIVTPDHDGWRITVNASLGENVQVTYPAAPWDSMIPGCYAARTGTRLLLPTRADGLAYDAEVMADVYATAQRSAWALIPMAIGDQQLGALAAAWTEEHQFSEQELDLLDAFAAHCAQGLERIATREAERTVATATRRLAETLQRSLLTEPVQPDHLQVAVRYRAAARDAKVGGDRTGARSGSVRTNEAIVLSAL